MKPQKFNRANVHLPVKSLRETLDYYHGMLGFYDEWVQANEQGQLTDGGIRRDDMRLLFGEDAAFVEAINSYTKSRLPLLLFVNNIDEIFAEFKERNIMFADELRLHPYGLREFAFVDINGYYVRVVEEA